MTTQNYEHYTNQRTGFTGVRVILFTFVILIVTACSQKQTIEADGNKDKDPSSIESNFPNKRAYFEMSNDSFVQGLEAVWIDDSRITVVLGIKTPKEDDWSNKFLSSLIKSDEVTYRDRLSNEFQMTKFEVDKTPDAIGATPSFELIVRIEKNKKFAILDSFFFGREINDLMDFITGEEMKKTDKVEIPIK